MHLSVLDPVHVPLWGVGVGTPHIELGADPRAALSAQLAVSVEVVNGASAATPVNVSVDIDGPSGARLGGGTATLLAPPNATRAPAKVSSGG